MRLEAEAAQRMQPLPSFLEETNMSTTFLRLLAQAYLTPQEVAIEARLPIEVAYAIRDGNPVQEEHARRVLSVINERLGTHIHLYEIQFHRQES